MSRFIAALAALYLSFTAVSADPLDDLQSTIQASDRDGAMALLAGAETPALRRDMMWALAASHPDTRAFTKGWAEAEPDNPAALTARAWSLYRAAFIIRGPYINAYTWPRSLATASEMLDQAFGLAEQALALDPSYLPASDAVIVIGEVSGHVRESEAEAARILKVAPNRHSLTLAASSVVEDWLGRVSVKKHLCDEYAAEVSDAPGYTAEMCVIDAVFFVKSCCEHDLAWASERIGAYIDDPLMEETVIAAALAYRLAPDQLDHLRERLSAEGRLTVRLALIGREDALSMPYEAGTDDPAPDLDMLDAALARDLAAATTAADRDPGDPEALEELSYHYSVAREIALRRTGRYQVPPPEGIEDDIEAVLAAAKARTEDLKARALILVSAAPQNVDALIFAGLTIYDHLPDPLEAALWRQAVLRNAVLYANYRGETFGTYLIGTKFDRRVLEDKITNGTAPDYDDTALVEAFDCPYIAALRLFDATCQDHGQDRDYCFSLAGLAYEDEFLTEESPMVLSEQLGTCEAERTGPLDDLWFLETDIGL